jgi:hypothetical protein
MLGKHINNLNAYIKNKLGEQGSIRYLEQGASDHTSVGREGSTHSDVLVPLVRHAAGVATSNPQGGIVGKLKIVRHDNNEKVSPDASRLGAFAEIGISQPALTGHVQGVS